ncbi:hypothetical protein CFIMG_008393RA00001 [Ceratocystis fimbriata CBS 114723]|uniref:CENP-V/GFA domain-containing protein n=1 Tax=Ceratocystis fimbriata CBS 114723 TaxID=1035309 RepID=A0A2C5XH61_9PEZI|nr:hypothetical protein CFIMG_008393RA00001 [Ceratocystis fimbriata CBS 114723]
MPAFTGSCVCGFVKLVVCMDLPPAPRLEAGIPPPDGQVRPLEIYKCNCTRCHKFGFFHVRPSNPKTDFFLLSPLDPLAELGDFQPVKHWFFCKTCGTRPFTFDGEGQVAEVDFGKMGDSVKHLGRQKVWRVKEYKYLSVNAHVIDGLQDGLDLRQWMEKNWIRYINALDPEGGNVRHEEPQAGGQY